MGPRAIPVSRLRVTRVAKATLEPGMWAGAGASELIPLRQFIVPTDTTAAPEAAVYTVRSEWVVPLSAQATGECARMRVVAGEKG